MTPYLFALPWLGLLLFVAFVAKIPSELPPALRAGATRRSGSADSARQPEFPFVSVIVPARNESVNIVGCVRSIAASAYARFEIIVIDDQSEDHTAELARSVPRGNAERIVVIDGAPLPEGWLGKPWACHQGARLAKGDVLLFTDADTTHEPDLMARSIAGLAEEAADLLTVVGRQLMETFWERLVQPQIFLMMLLRFPDFERIAKNDRWRDAIANGQYLVFPRSSYDSIGGHEAVADEVVEDLALAQLVKRQGLRLRIRSAYDDLSTRMYRSLRELVAGWSKNIVVGGLQSFPALLRPLIPLVSFLGGFALWLAAPLGLVMGALGLLSGPWLTWCVAVYAVSVLLWTYFSHRMGTAPAYGLLYPLGAAVGSFIFLRAWISGRNVEWKGRRYELRPLSERA